MADVATDITAASAEQRRLVSTAAAVLRRTRPTTLASDLPSEDGWSDEAPSSERGARATDSRQMRDSHLLSIVTSHRSRADVRPNASQSCVSHDSTDMTAAGSTAASAETVACTLSRLLVSSAMGCAGGNTGT